MHFFDRKEAGRALAAVLKHYHEKKGVVVLGLARGGVVVADEVICLYVREDFIGVGMYYDHFTQVDDMEVVELLKDSKAKFLSVGYFGASTGAAAALIAAAKMGTAISAVVSRGGVLIWQRTISLKFNHLLY